MGMTPRAVVVSLLLGILWHVMLFVLMGRPLTSALSWTLLAGAMAGLCAGYLTCLSCARHQGRPSGLDCVITYYAAAVAYAIGVVVIGRVVDACIGTPGLGVLDLLLTAFGSCFGSLLFATIMGVILIPLCFATQMLLLRTSGMMTSNKPREAASGEASKRES